MLSKEQFIEEVAKYVIKYGPQYGRCVASPIIAQLCLESANGTSNKVYCNGEWRHNYAGLKWRNGRCAISNDYFVETGSEQNADGSYRPITTKWCKFKSLEDCVIGYLQWTNISNYANLKGVTDPRKYLENIKADGYATSKNYVENLMKVIQSNNLTRFDKMLGGNKVSNSSLVVYEKISPHKAKRTGKIDTITIHCMAGNLSIESCGNVFQAGRQASSNYGIDSKGRVGLYVPEDYRSMCSSNRQNDERAITIEVANDGGAPDWHVSEKAMASLIALCADVCKRNGIKELKWSEVKNERINHLNGCNMTVHRDYAAKACPGNYLYSNMKFIATGVNHLLNIRTVEGAKKYKVTSDKVGYRKEPKDESPVIGVTGKGVFTIVEIVNNYGKLKSGLGWIRLDSEDVTKG